MINDTHDSLSAAIKRADANYSRFLESQVEVDRLSIKVADLDRLTEQVDALSIQLAALRDENDRLTEQVARLSALRTYVQEEILTDDQIAACAGFTHGYKAGALK